MTGTARYYAELGPAPTTPDRGAAADYHAAILTLLERDGWTHQERTNLQRLEQRWARRASGEDLRWALVGSKAGRLPKAKEQMLKPPADPAWGNSE